MSNPIADGGTGGIDLDAATHAHFCECARILRQLPDWFGIEEAIRSYVEDLSTSRVVIARRDGRVEGFLSLRDHNPMTSEIHVMAVTPGAHRSGVGRALVAEAVEHATGAGKKLLEVKTLGPSHPDHFYALTRRFYVAMGFHPLEELQDLWPGNPCLIMVKVLAD